MFSWLTIERVKKFLTSYKLCVNKVSIDGKSTDKVYSDGLLIWDKTMCVDDTELNINKEIVMFEKGDWRNAARDFYNNNYYKSNDDGHKIDHIDNVYSEMRRLDNQLELNLDDRLMFMAAYTHDLFTQSDRTDHHTLAMKYVLNARDEFLQQFTKDELQLIADAVNEHRASGKDHYSNNYSRILRLADKGVPNLDKIIMRSFWSTHAKYNSDVELTVHNIYLHLLDKYGRDGYGFKSADYRLVYGKELEEFWNKLDDINTGDIFCIVELNLEDDV